MDPLRLLFAEISIPYWGKVQLGWLRQVLIFLWILGLTNAYNFVDGLNGLAKAVGLL